MSTLNRNTNDLTFVPAEQLEQNLSIALDSIGQKLRHQKLQELAARVQGYASLNHRKTAPIPRESVTFLVTEVHNETCVDMTTLDAGYLLVTFTRDDLDKIQKALAATRAIDEWGSMGITAAAVEAYTEADDLDRDDLAGAEAALKASAENHVRTELLQTNVTPAVQNELWISGCERFGYPFSTPRLTLEALEAAFRTGEQPDNGEWLLLPTQEVCCE